MTDSCRGCELLRSRYKSAWNQGFTAGRLSNKSTADEALKALRELKADMDKTNALLTEALLKAEDEADWLRGQLELCRTT